MPAALPYLYIDGIEEPARSQLFRLIQELARAAHSPGDIKWSAGNGTQEGWQLCDGTLLKQAAQPGLFASIGTLYNTGGEAADEFRVPNAKGRVAVAYDASQTEFDVLGERGGSKSIVVGAVPGHTHSFTSSSVNTDHAHNVYADNRSTGGTSANHAHEFNSDGNAYSQVWTATANHTHQGSGGTTSEQPWGGGMWATNHYHHGWTAGQNTDHSHTQNHDHPSTNYASQSPWAGNYNHSHTGTTDAGTGGASAAGNMPPYITFYCYIKL